MSASVIVSIVTLICLSATVILVTVAFREALSKAYLALDSQSNAHQKHLDTVLDRLMAIRWEDYAVVRSTNDDESGGFILPGQDKDSEDDTVVVDDGKWGHLSTLRERLRLDEDEAALINEDFDESGSPR